MMESLKEWAGVVRALERGDQTILLRKGGILDTASGFEVKPGRFFLFPTYEHQEPGHIKDEFRHYLDAAGAPQDGTVRITSYAHALDERDIYTQEQLDALDGLHIWSGAYVQSRRDWMPERPLKAVLLRVFAIPELEIPMKAEYGGCRSWIDIDAQVPRGEPVLGDPEADSLLEQFRRVR